TASSPSRASTTSKSAARPCSGWGWCSSDHPHSDGCFPGTPKMLGDWIESLSPEAPTSQGGTMTEAIRIAVLNFVHETVTFLPNDTTLDDFVYEGSPARGEALLAWEPRSYMGGFVKVAREHGGVELVGIESPLWPRTGTGSGWITTQAYEHFLGRMLAEVEDGGRWHGVYLALHGAMGVRGVERPEADIARRVREVVGRGAFIAGTFDPRGNEDAEFLRQADF